MPTVRSEIGIQAPAAQVWYMLTNFQEYTDWNPFIRHVQGQAVPEAPFEMHMTPPDGGSMKTKARLVNVENETELRWQSHMVVPGLLDMEYKMRIEDVPNDKRVLFLQQVDIGGLLAPLFTGKATAMEKGFDVMNEALKDRAESLAGD